MLAFSDGIAAMHVKIIVAAHADVAWRAAIRWASDDEG